MRGVFIKTLMELMVRDSRILLLTGDLGFTVLEPVRDKFPDRFFNVGVAEQNMVGLATGLAEAGFIPFVYSIATFASLRPYEFIRNGPVMQNKPVRIIGIGGGFDYGSEGLTHHALEDIGIMRIQPGMIVIAPCDYEQARSVLLATWNLPQPIYYRLGKDDKTVISGLNGRFELGRTQVIGEGKDVLIITTGSIASEVTQAIEELAGRGILATLAIVASISPAPVDDLTHLLSRHRIALTIEAHYVNGGLGSMVSEVVAERSLGCRIVRCAVKSAPDGVSGSQNFLYRRHNLSKEGIVDTVLKSI